jgi:tRNA(Ile)-lysidine synthase
LGFGIWYFRLPLLAQIRRTIARGGLLPPGARVLVAVSGGSDSVALVLTLVELAERADFEVVALAHLNHRLRASAERDEHACLDLAGRVRRPLVIDRVDVRGYASAQRLSIEDAARRLRYDFLARAAAETGATRIAVGHTQDDQAETFLLKVIRGAGLTGLGGVYPQKGAVVRPLLDVSRADLRQYLASRQVTWVDDESNADVGNPRNRLRHVAIPELERAFGPQVRSALARAADLARDDGAWLDEVGGARYADIAKETANGIELDAIRLRAEPSPIARRILLMALRRIAGGREVGLEHVRSAMQVLADACGGTDVPGGRVELRHGILVLSLQGPRRSDTLNES